jgi:DNA-directed RNA polymerase specialized sigma24 family protein
MTANQGDRLERVPEREADPEAAALHQVLARLPDEYREPLLLQLIGTGHRRRPC